MARTHGRLLARIWSDDDFLSLSGEAQRLYMLLISQPNVTHAGTMSVTVRRWARMCPDSTVDTIIAGLKELSERSYVVVDWDTEELLIRTLIRNDGVYKQPRVFQVAAGEARAVTSRRIRAVLRRELERLPLDELTDKARPDVEKELWQLVSELPDTPPDTPAPTPPNGYREDAGKGIARAPRDTRPRTPGGSPSPAPSPSPSPVSDGPANRPPQLEVVPDLSEERADARPVVAAYVDGAKGSGRSEPSPRLKGKVGRDAVRLLKTGSPVDRLVAAARQMGSKGWDDLDRELQRLEPEPRRRSDVERMFG